MVLLPLLWASAALFTTRELLHFVTESESEPELEPRPLHGVVVEPAEPPARELERRELDQTIFLTTASIVCAGLGFIGLPFLRVSSVISALGGGLPLLRRSWQTKLRNPDYGDLVTARGLGLLLIGFPGVAALSWLSYAGGKRLTVLLHRLDPSARLEGLGFVPEAWLVDGEVEMQLAVEELVVGDALLVRAGERVPVDARVVAGSVYARSRMLGGEQRGRERGPSELLAASTEILAGAAIVEVERPYADGLVARVEAALAHSAPRSARIEYQPAAAAERTLALTGGLAGLGLLYAGPFGVVGGLRCNLIEFALLGAPVLEFNLRASAAIAGIEVGSAERFAALARADAIVLELGAIYEGRLVLRAVHARAGVRVDELLRYAAAARRGEERDAALARACKERGIEAAEVEVYGDALGLGLGLGLEGVQLLVGSEQLLREQGYPPPESFEPWAASCARRERDALTLEHVVVDGCYLGFVELAPVCRPSLRPLIDALRERGCMVALVSPAPERVTQAWADELGVNTFISQASAGDKVALVLALQDAGHEVAYVGGQLSDLLALRCADVAMCLGAPLEQLRAELDLVIPLAALDELEALLGAADRFAARRTQLIDGAQFQTLAAALGLAVLRPSIGLILAAYLASIGLTLGISTAPLGLSAGRIKALGGEDEAALGFEGKT